MIYLKTIIYNNGGSFKLHQSVFLVRALQQTKYVHIMSVVPVSPEYDICLNCWIQVRRLFYTSITPVLAFIFRIENQCIGLQQLTIDSFTAL